MYCGFCGAEIDDDSVFCDRCGHKTTEEKNVDSPVSDVQPFIQNNTEMPQKPSALSAKTKRKKEVIIWCSIGAAVLILLLVARSCAQIMNESNNWTESNIQDIQDYQGVEEVNDVVRETYEITDADVTDHFKEKICKAAYNSVEEEFYDAASIAKPHYEYLLFPDVNITALFTTIRGRITGEITPARFIVGNSRDGSSNKIYVLYSVPYEIYILDDETRNGEVVGAGTTYIATEIYNTIIIGDDYSLGSIYDPELYKNMQAFEIMIEQQKNEYVFTEYDVR